MKFSLSWIREFVDVGIDLTEISNRLTSVGLPVETIEEGPGGDRILDIEVFSNRPDCMNVYGVARELAAATGRALCPYPADVAEDDEAPAAGSLAAVTIEDPALCGRYAARLVRGARIGPGPDWLAGRLAAIGLRPVNNVVDITNYVLWELGHPIHAFDHDTLEGGQVRIRRAAKGESIVTLDGVGRSLAPDMLVIADAVKPVAIAGVMGGAATMVTDSTRNILIESAWFDPVSVRRTSKALGLSTDASYRFERGTDIESVVSALNRAADLIRQAAGATVCPGILDERAVPVRERTILLRPGRVSLVLGFPVEPGSIAGRLAALQFPTRMRGEDLEVEVPSHRQDVEREVDLIEEVARSIGYDSVPERLPDIPGSGRINRRGHRRIAALRQSLLAAGCSEAVTTSFTTASDDWGLRQRLDPDDPAIEPISLSNPVSADQEILRTTLLPGLLRAVARNVNHGTRDVRLFEIGNVFRRGEPRPASHEERKRPPQPPIEETLSIAVAMTGLVRPGSWLERSRDGTFFDLKGTVQSVLKDAGLECGFAPLARSEGLEGHVSSTILIDGRPAGRLGALAPAWRRQFEVKQPVYLAELNLSILLSHPEKKTTYRRPPRYPSVSRDLSLVVKKSVPYEKLEAAIREAAPDRVESVSVFDRYTGDEVSPGSIGLSVNIVYRHPDRTLESEEIARLQEEILRNLARKLEVTPRT